MLDKIKKINIIKRIRKTIWYSRTRQYFPKSKPKYMDDRDQLIDAEIVRIEWPASVKKPVFGIVQDYDVYPKWTKYRRFLENNSFDYGIYHIHRHDWIDLSNQFDIIIGIPSNTLYDLQEIRSKYEILETFREKICYPSSVHARLFEDKCLEAYIAKVANIPFAKTYVLTDKDDALQLIAQLKYPFVSKIVPSSASIGVELVLNFTQARQIVNEVFSQHGKKTHMIYHQQKNLVYFQEFIPNDGYDIRIIVVGNKVFGYYRNVLEGDFRASGMRKWEKRELPVEAMKIALKVNSVIESPVLAVDFLHDHEGKYTIIEYSPFYQMDSPEELHVNGIPGVYIFNQDGSYHFEIGKYWVAELALRELLQNNYLPKLYNKGNNIL